MGNVTTYDEDVFAWYQEQAAALRRLARTRRDLPNDLDLEHVAEELEDLSRSELRAVESFVELLLRHLVKLASAPDSRSVRHWWAETRNFRRLLGKDLSGSLRAKIEIDALWDVAVSRAGQAIGEHGDGLLHGLPARCPLSLDDLVDASVTPDRLVRRIVEAAHAA